MDIKKYEGSMSIEDFVEDITSSRWGCKTLGEVWEKCVKCNQCKYYEACHTISDQLLEERGINVTCKQVIDILLGDLKIEEVR